MGQVRLEEGSQSPLPEEGCPGYRGQVTPWQIIFHFFFQKKKKPPPFPLLIMTTIVIACKNPDRENQQTASIRRKSKQPRNQVGNLVSLATKSSLGRAGLRLSIFCAPEGPPSPPHTLFFLPSSFLLYPAPTPAHA